MEVAISHRIVPLQMLSFVTLTYILNVKVFRSHIIFNTWKTMKASEKYSGTSFMDVDNSHGMALLQNMLYIVTLAYILTVTQFLEIIIIIIHGKR